MQNDMHITTNDGFTLKIRKLTRADSANLQMFDSGLSRESHRKFFPHRYDGETLAKLLKRSENGDDLVLGAFNNTQLVGYFFLWYFTEDVPLLGIGITDQFQHRGLGQQMMTTLIEKAKNTGKKGIDLTTLQDNDAAFSLYKKMGFKYYGNVANRSGDGTIIIERAMFYEIIPGAKPPDRPHGAPA
ncbi:MAG: GNAT family N-acetyltransferase [Lentisphaerae bacterium]|nr:GNAT family N-acetyltransferase [Lentisphaerota bacterium]